METSVTYLKVYSFKGAARWEVYYNARLLCSFESLEVAIEAKDRLLALADEKLRAGA